MNNELEDNNRSRDMVEGSIFILLLLSTLLTQIQTPYFKYSIHNILIPLFALVLIWFRFDVLKEFSIYHRNTLVYVALLYLWMWISAFQSEYQHTAIKYSMKYSFYPLMFAAFICITYKSNRRNIHYLLITAFLLFLGVFGVIEIINPDLRVFKIMRPVVYHYYRTSSLMQNPNPFGALMAIGAILAIILRSKKAIPRVLFIPSIVLFVITVFLSGSRNAIFTLLMGVVLMLIFQYDKYKKYLMWILIASASAAIAVIVYLIMSNNRLFFLDNLMVRYLQTDNSIRLLLMKRSFYEIIQHPIFGVGIEVFSTHITPLFILGSVGLHTHNLILNILVELGAVGLILSILFFYPIVKNMDCRDPLTVIPLAMILISQIFDYFFHDYTYPAVALYLLALTMNSKNGNNQKPHLAV